MQSLIGTHIAEFRTAEHRGFPLGDLDPLHATPIAHRRLLRQSRIVAVARTSVNDMTFR